MRYSGTDCALMCNAPPMQADAQVGSGLCYNHTDFLDVFASNFARKTKSDSNWRSFFGMARRFFALFLL